MVWILLGCVNQQGVDYTDADSINDRLIGRTIDSNGDGTNDSTDHFVYDGNQIVLQLDDGGNVEHSLLWGPNVDQIRANENDSSGAYCI